MADQVTAPAVRELAIRCVALLRLRLGIQMPSTTLAEDQLELVITAAVGPLMDEAFQAVLDMDLLNGRVSRSTKERLEQQLARWRSQ